MKWLIILSILLIIIALICYKNKNPVETFVNKFKENDLDYVESYLK
jgi:hypothetical protein